MATLPFLILPKASPATREKGSPRFFSIHTPTPSRQKERLGPKFDRLRQLLDAPEDRRKIFTDSEGIYPDRTVVFELAQSKQNFRKAAEKLGLIWVGEDDVELEADDDFFPRDAAAAGSTTSDTVQANLDGRLYLTSPNAASLADLLRLWKLYIRDELPIGFKDWKETFSHLRDIRPWGPKDRLPRETLSYLESLSRQTQATVHLEVEAIFYGNQKRDDKTLDALEKAVAQLNAVVLDRVTIPEIRYHALLISIPRREIASLQQFESSLLKLDEIAYIRPQAMSLTTAADLEITENGKPSSPTGELRSPVAALFDGLPVQNHELLKERLIVVDPENLAATSPVNTRHHGTAMASLILHGDLGEKSLPLDRKLYVHCLLSGNAHSSTETTHKSKLILGLIFAAVKQMRENADLKDIFIVNLSLGDINRPFAGQMSAWARLIDYLSWRYNLLFVVSAGNIATPFALGDFAKPSQIASLSNAARQKSFIKSLENGFATRTIFSPAESINALTVGASHSDHAPKLSNPHLVDPFDTSDFPSVITGLGLGYRRAIKPDILHAGGRALCTYSTSIGKLQFHPGAAGKYFGQEVAAVFSPTATTRIIGTSNSAALVTRAAVQAFDAIQSLREGNPAFLNKPIHTACVLKALIVHSSSWGRAGKFLDGTVEPRSGRLWKSRRANITRLLGYGAIDIARITGCTEHRVTMIGTGMLSVDKAEIFQFPLPPSISGKKDVRRLTVTMGWMSPIRPGEQIYRSALLDFTPVDKNGFSIGVQRSSSSQPPGDMARRGTIVHEIFEGDNAVPIVDGEAFSIKVDCRTQGNGGSVPIPYAIVVTFEVAETIATDIYSEIATRIAVKPVTKVRV